MILEPNWRHDVFVSFSGADTRKGFASHLFQALKLADIRCYRDIKRDERGRVLDQVIRQSRVAIVLFSTNYASSKWCLKELVEIRDCNKTYERYGHMVMPIFYDVEPSEVRQQSGRFGEGFERCEAADEEERQEWKAALVEAGNIPSWQLDSDARDEAELIEQIVEDLLNRVFYFRSPYITNNAVGFVQNEDRLYSLLRSNDRVRIIGIHGMEGTGKTVLAKAICGRVYKEFEGVSILEDIQHADEEHKIVDLQKQLIKNVLKIKRSVLSDRRNRNIAEIRTRLRHKNILLVLDNIDKKEQAYSITGDHDFLSPGSRIFITTRDEKLLDELKVDAKFMVSGLNPDDSLRLFCHYAFGQGYPAKGYEKLATDLLHYAGGIPLAIETFGSFLAGTMREEWPKMLEKLVRNPRLDSLGVYLRSDSPLYPFKRVGAYGGSGNPYDDKTHTTVRKIKLVVNSVIQSFIVEYDHEGSLIRSAAHGGLYANGGTAFQVALDYPNEFLVSVSGYIAENFGFRVIRSLKFHSNNRMYGPFGEESGTSFAFPAVDDAKIIGLFGNCDSSFLDSIGAYFGPVPDPYPFKSKQNIDDGECETWDDKKHMDIRQINVVYTSNAVESISVIYDNYGHRSLGPFTHGRVSTDGQKYTVKLEYPYEYLTSISGYTDKVDDKLMVRCLTFESNKRKYGPFGSPVYMHFPAERSGGKIVGFFGTVVDSHLESISAHVEPVSHIYPLRDAGPFGGERGHHWDDKRHNNMRRIVITWDEGVVSSIMCVYDTDGIIIEGNQHGGSDGSNTHTIELDYPKEYIAMMSGYYGEVKEGVTVVKSLSFKSNIRTYGPFGEEDGFVQTYFRTPLNIGMINGFYGRSGSFLNAIGVHFAPVYHKLPLDAIGPFGDDSEEQWDDGKHSGIRKINIRSGQIVDSIGCEYDDNGEAVEGLDHGGNGGYAHVIELDYPGEYIQSISGNTGQLGTYMCIRSLTFKTNNRCFGPYGTEDGTPFSFESNDGKIVGFYGSTFAYLHSIGVHVKLFSDDDDQHRVV